MTIDVERMTSMTKQLLRKDFDVARAESSIGPVVDELLPTKLELQAKLPGVELATLDLIEEGGELVPSYVYIELDVPVPLDWVALQRAFGTPIESVRLKPDQPENVLFDVEGEDFIGNLLIAFVTDPDGQRRLSSFRIMRLERQ